MDQDTTEQKEQKREKGGMPTAGPRDKIYGNGQTSDAGNDKRRTPGVDKMDEKKKKKSNTCEVSSDSGYWECHQKGVQVPSR